VKVKTEKTEYVLADFKDPKKAELIEHFTEDGVNYVQSTKLRDALNSLLGTKFKRVYVRDRPRSIKQLESMVVQFGEEVFFKGGRFEWNAEDIYCWTSKKLILMSSSEWARFLWLY